MSDAPLAPPATAQPDPGLDQSARCRILQAAVDIFGRKGYAGTSVREIVERAGVTKPALYYHFHSKEGLMMAIIDGAAREVRRVVEEVQRHGGTARERIIALVLALRQLVRLHTSELRVVHSVYYFAPELLPAFDYRVFERIVLAEFDKALRLGIASGEMRPVSISHASLALGSVLGGVLDHELIHSDVVLQDSDVAHVLNLIFEGLCPSA